MKNKLLLIIVASIYSSLLFSQVKLVSDISTMAYQGGSNPSEKFEWNGKMYFSALDLENSTGQELYVYDGVNQPSLLFDLVPGPNSSYPRNFIEFDGNLCFITQLLNSQNNDFLLWSYDGINSPQLLYSFTEYIEELIVFNGLIYFKYNDQSTSIGEELYSFDGINAPQLVDDSNLGFSSSSPNNFTIFNNVLFYSAFSSTLNSQVLWKYDGTIPPEVVIDINTGYSVRYPSSFCEFNSKLYFSASYFNTGKELYSYNDVSGLTLVNDLNPGSNGSNPSELTVYNNKLHFVTEFTNGVSPIYQYTGTGVPTQVAAINFDDGFGGGQPNSFFQAFGNLYFSGATIQDGYKIWLYDGNAVPYIINNNTGAPNNYNAQKQTIIFGNKLILAASTPASGMELWSLNSTNQFQLIYDLNTGTEGSHPKELKKSNGELFFTAGKSNYHDFEPYKVDISGNVSQVSDINIVIPDSSSSDPNSYCEYNGVTYFSANDGVHGQELWRYDGVNPPSLVIDLAPGINSTNPEHLTVFYGKLYFVVGGTLMAYDGVQDPVQITTGCLELIVYAAKLYISKNNSTFERELWAYDGINPVFLVEDINPGSVSSNPSDFFIFNSKLHFNCQVGNQLVNMIYDGAIFTQLLTESWIRTQVINQNELFFIALDIPNSILRLWKYDGINPPVTIISNLTNTSGSLMDLAVLEDKIYLNYNDGVDDIGTELWSYSNNQVELVKDIFPGRISSALSNFEVYNGKLYFSANDGYHGQELFSYCPNPSYDTIVTTVCDNFTAPDGSVHTFSKEFDVSIPNAAGCDSIIHVSLTVGDLLAPVPNVSSLPTITATCSASLPQAPTATDNCLGTISGTTTTIFPITNVGTHTIEWKFEDNAGNSTIQNQTITVSNVDASIQGINDGVLSANNTDADEYQWINCSGNTLIQGEDDFTFEPTQLGLYAVIVSENGCTDTSACFLVTQVGLKETTMQNVLIYPNPTTSDLSIDLGKTIENLKLEIRDLNGKILFSENHSNTQIIQTSVENFSKGMYYIQLKYEGNVTIFKLIKQ